MASPRPEDLDIFGAPKGVSSPSPDKLDLFKPAGPEGSFVGNVIRGAKDTYSLVTEALPGMARAAVGDDEGAKKNLEQYKKDLEAHEAENPRTFKGDISDIHGVGDAWEFAKQAAAEMLPSILPSLATGGVGALVGKKAAEKGAEALARGVTEKMLAQGLAKTEAEKLGQQAAISAINKSIAVGAAAGSFPGSFAQNAPETFAGIFEETGQLRPGTAAFVGALKAGLDTIEPVLAIRRAMGPAASEALVDRIMAKVGMGGTGIASRIGRGAVEGAVTEGLTESAQEAMDVAAENIIKGSPELFDQKGLIRIATAGAAGAVGGGAFGGGAGFMSKAPSDEKSPDATAIAKSVEEEDRGSFKEVGTAVYDPREGLGDKLLSKFETPDKAISPAFWMKQTEAEDLEAAKAQMKSYALNGYLIEKDGKYYPNPAKPLEAEAPHEFTQRLTDRLSITENVAVPEKIEANPYDPQTEPEKFKAYQDFEDSKKFNEQTRAQLDAEEKEQARIQREIAARVPQTENFLVQQELAAQKKAEEENFRQRQEMVVARDQAEREAVAEQKAGEFSQKLWNEKAPEITQRDQQLAPTRETVSAAQESQAPQGPTSTEATVGAAQELFEGADAKEVTKATRNFFETATPGEKFTVGDIQGKQRQEGGISTPQHARELISDAINNDRVHVDEQQNLVVGPSPLPKATQAKLNKEWGVVKPKKQTITAKGESEASYDIMYNVQEYQATIKAPSFEQIQNNYRLSFQGGEVSSMLKGTEIAKYFEEMRKLLGIDIPITLISKVEIAYPGASPNMKMLRDKLFEKDSEWNGMHIPVEVGNGKSGSIIVVNTGLPLEDQISTIAHELGHTLENYYFRNAPKEIQEAVVQSFKNYGKINTPKEVLLNFFTAASAMKFDGLELSSAPLKNKANKEYLNSFGEWFAQQTAKWAQTDKKPVSIIEKFFKEIAEAIKKFFFKGISKNYFPTDAFQRYMDWSLSNKTEGKFHKSDAIAEASRDVLKLDKINPAKGADATIKFMSGWSKLTDSASNVAAKHKEATGYVNATNAMYEHANEIIAEEAPLVESYINLPKAQQERVAKVLLIGNIARQEYTPVNGNIVAVATDRIANTDVKKGDTITLTGPEVKAYLDFRKLFSDLKKKTLEVYSDNEKVPPSMNLQGYIPLIRQGEGLIVGTKQGSETAYVEAIKKKPFESHAHFVQRMKARAEEVNNENPGMYITHGEFNKNNFNSWELEKRLGYLNAIEMLEGAAGDKEISDFLEEKKKEYMGKSFKRHSIQRKEIHVQGYIAKGMSPADYISSAVGDYLAKSAHRIARQKYAGQIAKEVKIVEAANNPNLTQWVHNHHNYINSPQEEYGYVRAVAFHGLLGFNISSAVMNFFQPFQSTLPVLAANSNPVKATAAVLKGIGQVFRLGIVAVPKNKAQFHSFGFNEKALSKLTPELADILRNAYKKGHLTSTTQAEVAIRNEAVGGRFGKMWTNLLQASSYAFGAVELANRMATHIAAYELYKSDPKFVKNMEVLQKNSRFRDRQMSPAVAAEMINEMTQFNTSKANRPEMMRGAMTIPTQFMNYSIYSLELWGNALRGLGGPEGKAVAGQTLAYLSLMLFFMAGTMGMPFADNLDKFLRYLTKSAGMREFNLEYEVEKFWRSMGLSETSVRAMTHGKLGELLGVHIGPRLGLGNVIGGLSPNAVGGPAISMTMDKIDRAAADLRANRVGDAIVHGLLPQAMSNLHEAMVAGERGFQDRRFNVQMSPQQIAKENEGRVFPIQVAKGMGFTPQPLQNMRNIQQGTRYLEERNKPLKQSYMNQLGDALLQSHFARQAGDMEKSEKLKQEFQQILLKARRDDMETLKSGHPEDILKIDPQAVFRHVRENMMGALSPELIKGLPPHLRPAAMEIRKRNND